MENIVLLLVAILSACTRKSVLRYFRRIYSTQSKQFKSNVVFGITCQSCDHLITRLGNVLERVCLLRPFWTSLVGRRGSEEDMVKFFIFGLWKWGLSLKGSQHARRSSQAAVSDRDGGHSAEGRGPGEGASTRQRWRTLRRRWRRWWTGSKRIPEPNLCGWSWRGGSWGAGGHAWWGGRCAWSACRRVGTGSVSRQCGYAGVGPTRRNGQTSFRSQARCTERASHLDKNMSDPQLISSDGRD